MTVLLKEGGLALGSGTNACLSRVRAECGQGVAAPAEIQELRGQFIKQHLYSGLTQIYFREIQRFGSIAVTPGPEPCFALSPPQPLQEEEQTRRALSCWEQEVEEVVVREEQEHGTGETRKENLNLWNCTCSRRICTVCRFRSGHTSRAGGVWVLSLPVP